MNKRRLLDIVGVMLMGDAIVHLLRGKEHIRLWQGKDGRKSAYARSLEYLRHHPAVYGMISAMEFTVGAMLTQEAEEPSVETA